MRVKVYSWAEAINAPREMNGLQRQGFLWRRRDSKAVKWIFTSSIQNVSRTYPAGAEFMPVYSEGIT